MHCLLPNWWNGCIKIEIVPRVTCLLQCKYIWPLFNNKRENQTQQRTNCQRTQCFYRGSGSDIICDGLFTLHLFKNVQNLCGFFLSFRLIIFFFLLIKKKINKQIEIKMSVEDLMKLSDQL